MGRPKRRVGKSQLGLVHAGSRDDEMAQHQLNVTESRSREYIGLTSDEGSGNSLRQGVSGKACGDMLDGADGAERSTCMSANVCCSAGQTHGPRDHVHNL